MTNRLGFTVGKEWEGRLRLTVSGDGPGKTIEILVANDRAPAARNGLGTVHHVAMAVAEADEQLRIRQELVEFGVSVTPVMDRQYLQFDRLRRTGRRAVRGRDGQTRDS